MILPFVGVYVIAFLTRLKIALLKRALSPIAIASICLISQSHSNSLLLLEKEKYSEAQLNYLKLIELNPTKSIYNFETGLSFYLSNFEKTKSIPYFEAALNNSKEDTIPDLYYYLGKAYHLNGEYQKATTAFKAFKPFINLKTSAGKLMLKEVDYYIGKNKIGLQFSNNQSEKIKVKNLGNSINSNHCINRSC